MPASVEIDGLTIGEDAVAILVGPNGSGKSRYLRKLAASTRKFRTVAVISNTAYDRFARMQGLERLSAGRGGSSPVKIVKDAVAMTIDGDDSRFFQIGGILEYCGYEPRIGFRIDGPIHTSIDSDEEKLPPELVVKAGTPQDFELSIDFLERYQLGETVWIDQTDSALKFSQARQFASVLRNEKVLIDRKIIRGVRVFIQKRGRLTIELMRASSGEIGLISSLVFLISRTGRSPLVLIDEPENSLHPAWQRDYLEKIMAAMSYRGATVLIATHAPLIVTGAIAKMNNLVSVFQLLNGSPHRMKLGEVKQSGGSIEEVLWKAFDVITPANHFVSEELVEEVGKFERGEITKAEILGLVGRMDGKSFDERQKQFFGAVKKLIDEVDPNAMVKDGGNG